MTPLLELLQLGKVHEARQQASARLLIQPNDPEALLALARIAGETAPLIFCGFKIVVYPSMTPRASSASMRLLTATRESPTACPIWE